MKLFANLLCSLTNHRYRVEKVFSSYSRKIGCTRCKKSWAMNDDARCFLPWDDVFERHHASIDDKLK
jgi:hypothetical protein